MKHYMKKWMLFHQLGLQVDTTIYVAMKWCGHTEPIKEERVAEKCLENGDQGVGCFGNGGKKKEKKKENA